MLAPLKVLVIVSALFLVTPGICQLCCSGFPVSGCPQRQHCTPFCGRPCWLPSVLCPADQPQWGGGWDLHLRAASVATESAQGSSNFNVHASVILPSIAKVTWAFGDWVGGGFDGKLFVNLLPHPDTGCLERAWTTPCLFFPGLLVSSGKAVSPRCAWGLEWT